MASPDRLEIISPNGDIRFYDLDPTRGVTNIGRHPDNDVIIDSPSVGLFHAVLHHQQRPYQLIVLGEAAGSARTLNSYDALNLDGYSLLLLAGDAEGAAPPPASLALTVAPPVALAVAAGEETRAPAAVGPVLGGLLATRQDEVVMAEFSAREFTVDVDQPVTCTVKVTNGGDIVATFQVSVQGLDDRWVSVSPPEHNLNERQPGVFTITIVPPRAPSSRAGAHPFGLVVSSPNYPGRVSQIPATLTINPYYEFGISDLSPKQQNIPYGKRLGRADFSLSNTGNSELKLQAQALDDARACQFEFQTEPSAAPQARQVEIALQPEETRPVGLLIAPLKRIFFGLQGRAHAYSVQVAPLNAAVSPRTVLGQAQSLPLIGPLHVAVLLILLAILGIFLFRPRISSFSAVPAQVMSSEITAGKKVTLSWNVSWLSSASIDQGVGQVKSGTSGNVTVAPVKTTTYRLSATNLISALIPAFAATREQTVIVDPVQPIVRLSVDKDHVLEGDTVTLSWEVLNASEVVLKTNGTPETLPPEQYVGRREVTPKGETTYSIEARNLYTTGTGIVQTRVVNATQPTPTPLPPPVIQLFNVPPGPVTAGDTVTLEWSVIGVDKVTIQPLGDFPPVGKTIDKPSKTTTYQLVASNGQQEVRSLHELVVNPPPTATPVPGVPKIDVLTTSPSQVALGSPDMSNVQLTWAVSGDFTDIQLSGATIGRVTGLPARGTRTVSAGTKDTDFVLTVQNGPLTASQTATVKVVVPVPVISSLSPASTVAGGNSNLSVTVNGANFVSGAAVRWVGEDQPTVFVNNTQLTAIIPPSAFAATGRFAVTVFNPADSGGGTSNAVSFVVHNPVPVLTDLSVYSVTVGASQDLALGLVGSGFVPDSKVLWSGVALQTTYNDQNDLTADVPVADLSSAGNYIVSVINSNGGSSSGKTFTVANPAPTIATFTPGSTPVQPVSPFSDVTVDILGTGFLNNSVISWNGAIISGARIQYSLGTPQDLKVSVPGSYFQTVGPVNVSVINPAPGGGPSAPPPVRFKVIPINTTLTLAASSIIGLTGQPINFVASVGPTGLTPSPTGKVTFWSGATRLNQATVGTGATAALTWSFPASTVNITSTYSGDNIYNASTSPLVAISIQKAQATVTAIQSTPSVYGQAVQFTAALGAAYPGTTSPVGPCGGEVQFFLNGSPFGAPVSVPSPSCPSSVSTPPNTTLTVAGPNNITAQYFQNGGSTSDVNFVDSLVSNPAMPHMVNRATPSMTLTDNRPGSFDYGTLLSLTAALTSPVGAPTAGTVAFTATPQGGSPIALGSVPIAGGAATLTPANIFDAGTTTFQAAFTSGDNNFNSASAQELHVINKIAPQAYFICGRGLSGTVAFFGWVIPPASLPVPTGTMSFTVQNLVTNSVEVVRPPLDATGRTPNPYSTSTFTDTSKITTQYVPATPSNYSGIPAINIGPPDPTYCIVY
jgi:hypothetical protein